MNFSVFSLPSRLQLMYTVGTSSAGCSVTSVAGHSCVEQCGVMKGFLLNTLW